MWELDKWLAQINMIHSNAVVSNAQIHTSVGFGEHIEWKILPFLAYR